MINSIEKSFSSDEHDVDMSTLPTNLAGSISQVHISAAEASRSSDAQRNKQARESREMARVDDQMQSEVEDTEQAEDLVVRRQDESQHDGQGDHDQRHGENEPSQQLYSSDGKPLEPKRDMSPDSSDDAAPASHIDLSA